jgi:general secretion pathway protein K
MRDARCLGKKRESQTAQHGIALILVLWVLTILMGIVLSFSYAARIETLATITFHQRIKKKFLAEAGIERGIMEIYYRLNNRFLNRDDIVRIDGTAYTYQTDDGQYVIRITDESGKVDINKAPEVLLRAMFTNIGLEPEDVDIIVDSIMDWRDEDDLYRLNGAESDYYEALPNPFPAKNADFDTLEELIMVRGITPAILYGTGEQRGVIDFLTIYSDSGKINLDAAPREVLLAIPGISPDTADRNIDLRESQGSYNLRAGLGEASAVASPYLTTEASRTFSLEAVGYTGAEKAGYGIKAVVTIGNPNAYNQSGYYYRYYKSPVDIKHARDTHS